MSKQRADVRGALKAEREFYRYWESRQQQRLEQARKRAEQAKQFMEWKKAKHEQDGQ